ncbi:MAG TPA: hypothetical protein VKU85_12360 [bacterium]|nr:hypothetical protein [bacterium]
MHPSEKQLIDFALAESDENEAGRVRKHVEGEACRTCSEAVESYRDLFLLMREDRTPEPPAAWVERAIALGRPSRLARVRDWCAGLAEEAARMVFDSFGSPGLAPAGVRSADTERRLRFESGGIELDVRMEPAGRGGVVTGQLVDISGDPEPLAGARYLLTAGAADPVEGETDELGEFSEQIPDLTDLQIRVMRDDRVAFFRIPGAPAGGG